MYYARVSLNDEIWAGCFKFQVGTGERATHSGGSLSGSANTRVRLLQLVLQLSLGGAESMVALLASHIDRARYDVEVWSLDSGGENVERLKSRGVPVRVLEKGRGIRPEFVRSFRSLLRSERFDIIHAHNAPAARWALLGGLGQRPRPILVRTDHTFNRSKRAAYAFGHPLTSGWFDRIVGVSELTTAAHRRWDPLWRSRYVTIPNGIDMSGGKQLPAIDAEARRKLGLDVEGKLIVNLGNLRQPKGQEYLLEAFRRLAPGFQDVELLILGEGPRRDEFEAFCREHRLESRVHMVGHRPDAAELLPAADLVVQSSVREGMPVSLLEAARACRPIVATDVGGTRELIKNGETGILVPPADPEALRLGMEALLGDSGRADSLALAARHRLGEDHDIRRIVERTEALYATLLKQRLSA